MLRFPFDSVESLEALLGKKEKIKEIFFAYAFVTNDLSDEQRAVVALFLQQKRFWNRHPLLVEYSSKLNSLAGVCVPSEDRLKFFGGGV